MYRDLYGAWALVIGASVTLGEEFARQLGAKGMNVAMVARRKDRLDAIAEDIREAHGVETRTIALDLLKETAIEELIDATRDLEIGFLVVNANRHAVEYFHAMPIEDKHDMLRMNLELPVKLTHHYGARMVERQRGAIVLINSMNSLAPLDIDAVFQGTKAGLRIFAESLWIEYRRFGVRVASAHVNGIEGSESFEAKISLARRRLIKALGVSMAPRETVTQMLKQLDRGKVILLPDSWTFLNLLTLKVTDLTRFIGGKLSILLPSSFFHWFLDGEDSRAGSSDTAEDRDPEKSE
jgi:short-subunit dehydrogenase